MTFERKSNKKEKVISKKVVIAHKKDASCVEHVDPPISTVTMAMCDPPTPISTWENQESTISKCSHGEFKISVWNVNGIRSVLKPNALFDNTAPLLAYIEKEEPDVFCINETKIHAELIDQFKGYFVCSEKKGYAGVATFIHTNVTAELIQEGLGDAEHDAEGRSQTFRITPSGNIPSFYLVNTYVVNAGQGLTRLHYKITSYNKKLFNYLNELCQSHPVIWAGDLNVAHEEIDIWNSKGNQKSSGHTPQERLSFHEFLKDGKWFDVFRKLNPQKIQYTYWSAMQRQNLEKNRGWRIDYFVVTNDIFSHVHEMFTRDFVRGSDHCPIVLTLKEKDLKETSQSE
ncbi:uncharacterized protein LOC128882968 isoform X2 [Hylaeus volcanicus]|uniref:uncharacterized protein LOC128882968 isoform X2 n=1 Tax=Hylaeus volcanicus TaxID=313075 RepID=UPI0023B7EF3C|nr:uncharacterized protein LOC128882968 isoform X2 [Hylaeus volcanicus]